MRNATLDIRRVSGAVGAEILDIDLSRPHPDATWGEIRQALNQHGVVFFRDQALTPEQQIDFAHRFGPITNSAYQPLVPGYPELAEVRKEPEQRKNVGGSYHTDQAFLEKPTLGTILLGRIIPEFGGDTLFVSMAAAFDALSDGLKHTLRGLRAIHSNAHVFGPLARESGRTNDNGMVNLERATDTASHPMVFRHPESGREVLYVNPAYTTHIEGWTAAESAPLLQYLYQHAQRPEFACRFRWREGSMAFWDNRQCWHYAVNDYHGQRRLMHRIMVAGTGFE